MAIPSGLGAQLGIGAETTHGTAVTVSRFYEFVNESVTATYERLESSGLRAGTRVQRTDRWATGSVSVGGAIEMELANKSFGLWLKHAMGGGAATQPDSTNSSTVYELTYTPDDLPAGLTVQFGRPSTDGTAQPFTYDGVNIVDWELEAALDEIARFSVGVNGQGETTGTALATASFPASLSLLTFTGATFSIAGAEVCARNVTLRGTNALRTDRRCLGSANRSQPLEVGMREYTGQAQIYFDDLTAYGRITAGTEATLTMFFNGGLIDNTYSYGLEITGNARFDSETPTVDGPDEIEQPLSFKLVSSDGTAASAISMVYRTTDTTD